MTKPLSEIPFDKLSVGDPLISAINNPGKIAEIIPAGTKCSRGYTWDEPTIIIKWDAGNFSFAPHVDCDRIIYNKENQ